MTNERQRAWARSEPTTPLSRRPQQPSHYIAPPRVAAPSARYVDPNARVMPRTLAGGPARRIFQALTGAVGAALFALGLIAVFRVDFGAGMFETSGSVADVDFSPALAVAAVVLGAAIFVLSLMPWWSGPRRPTQVQRVR